MADETLMDMFIKTLDVYNTVSQLLSKSYLFLLKFFFLSQILPLISLWPLYNKKDKKIIKNTKAKN